jgi:hypothetical protein
MRKTKCFQLFTVCLNYEYRKYIFILLSLLINHSLFSQSAGIQFNSGFVRLKLILTSTPRISNCGILIPNIFNPGTGQGNYIDTKKNGKVETDEFSVTSGQNFSVTVYGGTATGCTTLKLEAFVNGKLIQTISHTAGGQQGTTTCEYPASSILTAVYGLPCNIIIP